MREERFERANLTVSRAESRDLTRERPRLITRLVDARADGLRRDRSRDRWSLDIPWHWVGPA